MRVSPWFALVSALFGTLFFPHIHLFYFAPYFVLTFYHHTRFVTLWKAIGCGLFLDLLSSPPYFGFTALNYCMVCWILYGQKQNFFEDKLFTLPLMTLFVSMLSTLFFVVLFLFFAHPIPLSFKWLLTDWIGMSFFDAGYAFFLSIPFQITTKLRKVIKAKRRAT